MNSPTSARTGLSLSSQLARRWFSALAGWLALATLSATAQINGTWSNPAGGSWATAANWTNSVIAVGSGSSANFNNLNLTADATVSLNGARTIGKLFFSDTTPSNGWILNTGSGGSLTLAIGTGTPEISVANGTSTINAVLAGTNGFTKTGFGTLILGAANSYTGTTQISAGTLLVTGSLATGPSTVAIGGTLAGTGTINGPVVASGKIAPGNEGVGTLSIKNTLNLSSTAQTVMEIAKTGTVLTSDRVTDVTTFAMGGTLTVALKAGSAALAHGDVFNLFSATTRSGAFDSVALPPLPVGYTWKTSELATQGRISVWAPYDPGDLTLSPTTDLLDVGFGQAGTLSRTLINANPDLPAQWVVFAPPARANSATLAETLSGLVPRQTLFNQAISDRYHFTGGTTGNGISDTKLFPSSNGIRVTYTPNPAQPWITPDLSLANTNSTIGSAGESGGGAQPYFTCKGEGFWGLSADLVRCTTLSMWYFSATAARASSATTISHAGTSWKVFIFKDRPATSNSLHQLIITPDAPAIIRPASDSYFSVTGLPPSCRVHCMVFSKPGTAYYDDATCLKVAKAWLAAAAPPETWLGLPALTGTLPGGQNAPLSLFPDSTGLNPGSHVARWAVAPSDFDIWTLPDGSFGSTTLQVGAAEFTVDRPAIDLSPAVGATPGRQRIRLTGGNGFSLADPLLTSSQPWVVPMASENRLGEIDLSFDTRNLPAGTHQATVTITLGNTRQNVTVRLTIKALNVACLVADPWRNRVYGIDQTGAAPGSLLVIDPTDASVLRTLPLGAWTTDLAATPDGAILYALGTGEGRIRRFDLDRLVELDSRAIPDWTNSTAATTLPHLLVGPTGLLYFLGAEGSAPALRVFNYDSGTLLQSVRPAGSNGFSSFCFDPGNPRLLATTASSWSFQAAARTIAIPVNPDGQLGAIPSLGLDETDSIPSAASGARLFAPPEGGPLYFRDSAIASSSLARTSPSFGSRVLALSANGKALATQSAVLRADDASNLLALNATMPVLTFSADQRRLVGFESTTKTLKSFDLAPLAGILGNITAPADGSDGFNGTLAWEPVTGASLYHVYMSTDSAALRPAGGARPADSLRVGSVADNRLQVPTTLSPGSGWFWRVYPVTLNGIGVGTVRSFTVPAAFPAARELRFDAIRGLTFDQRIVPLALAPGAPAWTASSDQPWLVASGTGSTLEAVVQPTSLAAGWYRGTISVQCAGTTARIPVTLRVRAPKITLVHSDPELSRVYAVHEDTSDDPAFGGQVLTINAATTAIVRQTPAGRSVTSLAAHVADDRLYLTNWRTGALVAINRTTLSEEQRWPFPPFAGVGYSREDAHQVAAGGPGRVIVEGGDQTIAARWFDTTTGTIVAQSLLSAGNGRFGPDGLTYYHGVMNSSYALQKYDLSGGSLALLKSQQPTRSLGYSAPLRSLVVAPNGERLFWHATAFTDELVEINNYGQIVHDCATDGAYAVTSARIVNTSSAATLFTLPFTTDLLAVSHPSRKLFTFRAAPAAGEAMFQVTNLESALALGTTEPASPIANGAVVNGSLSTLTWTADSLAKSYRVFFGDNAAAVSAAGAGSPLEIAATPLTTATLPEPLVPGRTYYWRLDRVGHYGGDEGDVRSFAVAPVVLSKAASTIQQPIQVPVPRTALDLTAPAAVSWQATTPTAWISLAATSGSTPATLSFDINKTGLAAGTHTGVIRVTADGRTLDHPVTLTLLATNYTRIVSDPSLPRVYGINQAAVSATDPAYLVVIDAATGNALSSAPVGTAATDLAVHVADNRIYVTNWYGGKLLALNTTTLTEERQYAFGPRYSTTDAYLVAAGPAGRVMVEASDQSISIQLLDTAAGTIAGTFSTRQGGGEFDPAGRYYWHGTNNISNAALQKLDTQTHPFTRTASLRPTSMLSTFGSGILTVSGDGGRIFWNGNMFDTTPTSLWYLASHIFASNTDGSRALGSTVLFNTVARTTVLTLPRTATDGAWNPDTDRWFYLSAGQLYSFTAPAPVAAAPSPNLASTTAGADTAGLFGDFLPVTGHLIVDDSFILRFRRAAGDAAVPLIETSTDLLTWEPLPEQPVTAVAGEDGVETMESAIPLAGPKRFFRIRRH